MIKDGTYYATKTLLWSEEDKNIRIIYRWPSDRVMCHFNPHMNKWTERDEINLNLVLKALNGKLPIRPNDGLARVVLVGCTGHESVVMEGPGFAIDTHAIPGSIILTPMNGEPNAE